MSITMISTGIDDVKAQQIQVTIGFTKEIVWSYIDTNYFAQTRHFNINYINVADNKILFLLHCINWHESGKTAYHLPIA